MRLRRTSLVYHERQNLKRQQGGVQSISHGEYSGDVAVIVCATAVVVVL